VDILTLDVLAPADAITDLTRAWRTDKPRKSARISFATTELLWRVLTLKRCILLKALCGAGPVSIRVAAIGGRRPYLPLALRCW
jgi:predicted transcriptional regulator